MISPFNPPKINSGDKASIVNDASIWNSQFKIRLFNLSQNLQNAIQENDRRNVEYFLGLIARLQYHPTNHWTTFMPIDMLLLPKTPRCYRKGHKNHRKKSQLASSSHPTSQSKPPLGGWGGQRCAWPLSGYIKEMASKRKEAVQLISSTSW